jgi:excinuclease UvrABC nuclease subunit
MRILSIALIAFVATVITAEFSPSELVNQAKQCLQDNSGDKKKAVECVAKILGDDFQTAKQKVEALLNGGDQKVIEFLKSKAEQIQQVLGKHEIFGKIHDKVNEIKDKAEGWISGILGKREKRDMPTQAEIQLAKQVKICIDMGTDKASCIAKILGGNHPEIDLVKLDTIVKYEDVLKELKEFFEYQKQGHSLKEFIEYKKQQHAAQNRLALPLPQVQTLFELKNILTECISALQNKDVIKCAVSLLGPEATSAKNLIEELIKKTDPEVIEFAKGKGKELHQFLEQKPGTISKIHEIGHNVFSWIQNTLG